MSNDYLHSVVRCRGHVTSLLEPSHQAETERIENVHGGESSSSFPSVPNVFYCLLLPQQNVAIGA